MKREKTIELIHDFFRGNDWKYDYDQENAVFYAIISMDNIIGNLRLRIVVRDRYYKVYAILANKSDMDHIEKVAEYLHRANYDLNNGNFELNYRDGEVRYKTFVEFLGVEFTGTTVEKSILIPIIMFDRYGKNLMKVMLGDDSLEELLNEAELSEQS